MSTKPATVPRWANVSGLLVTPPSAKLDIGFLAAERPPAEYINWALNWNGQWAQYVSDGDLTLNSITCATTIVSTGLITANGGMTLGTNQNVTLQGTGDLKHGTRTLTLAAMAFVSSVGSVTYSKNQGVTASPLNVQAAIPLRVGDRILAVRVIVFDNATGPTKLQFTVIDTDGAGSFATLGTSNLSAGNGTLQTLSVTSLTATIATGHGYGIFLGTTTGAAQGFAYTIAVDYDHP